MIRAALVFSFLVCLPVAAYAQEPALHLPLDCRLDETCWIVNYVDTDPTDEMRDFYCGTRTYNDHHGTDFAVRDLLAVEQGVFVLAAADGKVLRTRDGMEDKTVTGEERRRLLEDNRGCGNGVVIDHGGGWQTIYCHMKKESVAVKNGQAVKAGDRLGQVGYSGIAEFPHLHFGVFFESQTIDPFTGLGTDRDCTAEGEALWHADFNVPYQPVSVYATGFKAGVPDFDAIKIEAYSPDSVASSAEALTFWAAFYGVKRDDVITLEIRDPGERVFSRREIIQSEDRARQFYFIGRRVREPLTPGTYTGHVHLVREQGTDTIERQARKTLKVE